MAVLVMPRGPGLIGGLIDIAPIAFQSYQQSGGLSLIEVATWPEQPGCLDAFFNTGLGQNMGLALEFT